MNTSRTRPRWSTASDSPPPSRSDRLKTTGARRWRWLAAGAAIVTLTGCAQAQAQAIGSAGSGPDGPRYQATIVRTAYGIPHITADNFGSLGYGYGFALASDDICTMANGYVTVEGERSLYFGPVGQVPGVPVSNIDSDVFWQSVIDRKVIPQMLAVRVGPGAVTHQFRQMVVGYAAGYNHYLASVGGSAGVTDPTCRGKAWVKPITAVDAYLLMYQAIDNAGQVSAIGGIAEAKPPASTAAASGPRTALTTHAPPGTDGLPSAAQLERLGRQLSPGARGGALGSNAIAIGSEGTPGHQHGMLLGNPHYPWDGIDRFYQAQFTIPGTLNVEGATLYGVPLVLIGFTSRLAWSLTVSTANTFTPYQLTLVPKHPTQYVYKGKPVAMTSQKVTIKESVAGGKVKPVSRTLWSTRYGPVITSLDGTEVPWNTQTAFALDDANASNSRFFNQFLATDEANSVPGELAILKKYQGSPWVNTIAADSAGHALYSDIQVIPDVTDAEAARCDTSLGAVTFTELGLPILDGSRPSCAWGSDADSAARGILGPAAEPSLLTRDFAENSNNGYWLANPADPLTGYARIVGGSAQPGTSPGLRARSALTMVIQRISGSDGLGSPGFTFQGMKNLMFSDIQYGATLVKPQLTAMCRSFPGGLAPTSAGTTIPVGDACRVLAAWHDREDLGSRGAVLFRAFWQRVLMLPAGPWSHPFDPTRPVGTPYGLDTSNPQVQQAFGDALSSMAAAHVPYNVRLGAVQYVVRNGKHIPLPGGPGDPEGEFNAIYQNVIAQPGADPVSGSSYIQDVTWTSGDACPKAATLLTYSESANPASPYSADQTELFSRSRWVAAYFCPSEVAAHSVSARVVHS
jgi:acyl-homoserine-lactone acylase